jgi:D-glycero-D-manno-heptose 1,7-bisphosphate phosphatase
MNPKRAAIFLDRDCVLNEDSGYPYKVSEAVLLPGVGEALKKLKDSGFCLLVITNQSGIAYGKFKASDVDKFHAALQENLKQFDVQIDAFYTCPHHVQGKVAEFSVKCECRKPGILNVQKAIKDFNVDVSKSYFIGDKDSDIECGLAANIAPIQILNPKSKPHERALKHVKNLIEAVEFIKTGPSQ